MVAFGRRTKSARIGWSVFVAQLVQEGWLYCCWILSSTSLQKGWVINSWQSVIVGVNGFAKLEIWARF
jgi:hypothetical protein